MWTIVSDFYLMLNSTLQSGNHSDMENAPEGNVCLDQVGDGDTIS
jgi:hypothetical protein